MAKIGDGSFKAWLRQGHKEAAQLLQALPDSTVRVVEEPGAMGSALPMEVYQDRHAGTEPTLSQLVEQAKARTGPDRGDRQPEVGD